MPGTGAALAGRRTGPADATHFMELPAQGTAPPPVDDGLGCQRVGLGRVLDTLDDGTTVADTLPGTWGSAHMSLPRLSITY
jgi:hypothetical protein